MNDSATVADIGESGLLGRFLPLLPAGSHTLLGPGDDAAVIAAPGSRILVSTDVLVAGRHFRPEWSTGRDVGRRAAMQNMADIAAMGGRASALVVALVLPPTTPVSWVEDLARGLAEACTPVGVGVVGGDLSAGQEVSVAVTVLGRGAGGIGPVVLRSGARPGDLLALSGTPGRSAAGLALLGACGSRAAVPSRFAGLVETYLCPDPPLEDGPVAARVGAQAMMDVSDGLLVDARRMAVAGGVVVDLDTAGRALTEAVEDLLDAAAHVLACTAPQPVGHRDIVDLARSWVLTGGEDHGLLAAFPRGEDRGIEGHGAPPAHHARALVEPQDLAGRPPGGFRVVGRVSEPGPPGSVREPGTLLVDGQAAPAGGGWDHFAR